MNLKLGAILQIIGLVMVAISVAMLPSFFVSIYYGESEVMFTFIKVIAPTAVVGFVLAKLLPNGKHHSGSLKLRDGFVILTLSWLLASVIGALPFCISGSIPSFIDSLFESFSGFTTTGASILTDIEALPKGILFWRSFTQWLGGMGILIFAIALMPSLGISGQNIIVSDIPRAILEKFTPKMKDTVKMLLEVYAALTITEILLLIIGGVNVYDALTHAFGTVSTGGFSTYNDSIGFFNSTYVRVVVTVFMILCGTNFNLFFLAKKKGLRVLGVDIELRYYLAFFIFTSASIFAVILLTDSTPNVCVALGDSTFQSASILTTTGYFTCDYDAWHETGKAVVLLLMFIGGCSSSTSGGIKVVRIVVLLKLITRGISTRLHPHVVRTAQVSGKTLPNDTVSAIANHMFLYILLMFIGAFLISFDSSDMMGCFTSVITCLGNIGAGLGSAGPAGNFASMSAFSKLVLAATMLAGRLELYTLFVFFTPKFWDKNN